MTAKWIKLTGIGIPQGSTPSAQILFRHQHTQGTPPLCPALKEAHRCTKKGQAILDGANIPSLSPPCDRQFSALRKEHSSGSKHSRDPCGHGVLSLAYTNDNSGPVNRTFSTGGSWCRCHRRQTVLD